MRRGCAHLLLLAAIGCGPDRAAQLQQEIAQLRDARVEREAVAQARSEADAAEVAAQAAADALSALREERAGVEREQAGGRAALVAEQARIDEARRDTANAHERTRAALAEAEELEKREEQVRLRASAARDQAAAFARELRPGDETWATERRLRSLREFLARLAGEYPDDPVLAELARRAAAGTPPQTASDLAARARDRISAVYGLASPAVASPGRSAPADGASPP